MNNKIDFSKPVQTRDGRKARVICTDKKDSRSVIALIEGDDGGTESVYVYYTDGRGSLALEYTFDLINVPEKIVGYVNIYPNRYNQYHKDKGTADACASKARIACIKVEGVEGQFDE